MKKQSIASALVAAVAVCGAGAAHAQAAGNVMVQLGWNKIMPKVRSSDLSAPSLPGSQINIKSASAVFATLTYMVTDDISVEALGGLPYKHDIVGAGAVSGVGKIGSIHQISPTVLLQYRFLESLGPFRPYVGAGPTFAKFYGSSGSAALTAFTNPGGPPTKIGGDTEWGGTLQAGANYKIDKHWFLDAEILKTFISTKAQLSTGQETRARLNPIAINASIGYTF
ncbi:OmpW/AlkL family protein [Scleromatobacter humisilvae]|uniref:Outer membrane beta-barrel protein n=1 Tax=Scleromatobacter humisilvae TaxID=2897159 RepID=A0A9X1YPM6_9BURK|nr:OmpW family outer membrane protein [Scleromatobacter humisilvae]MCK9685491.1 outer membrane beta-barrel protein [Scleromatobacter humisilvae]